MAEENNNSTIIALAGMMGEMKKGLQNVEAQVTDLRNDYNAGREKAIAAHQQIVGVLNEKMDRSELKTTYDVVPKAQWVKDNWIIIMLIISLGIALGFLRKGDRLETVKEIVSTVKDGKKTSK